MSDPNPAWWRWCRTCDVKWWGTPKCWCCDGDVTAQAAMSPTITGGGMRVTKPAGVR